MSIHAALQHRTHYTYDKPVAHSPHVIRLRPAPHCRTPILAYSLRIKPEQHFINWQQDPHGNYLARVVFPEPTAELDITVDLVAEMSVYNPFDFFLEPEAENFPLTYSPATSRELTPYLELMQDGPLLKAYVAAIPRTRTRIMDFLVALNRKVQQDISYLIRLEPGVQSPDETLKLRSGSCRDSAWLLVQILRSLGLASRFVSGYLLQLAPDQKALDGPSGTETDFTDLHAWCEVFLPGAGWVGFDPTSGLLAGEGHIPLACTPGTGSAAPVTGATDPCESEMEHRMSLTRIYESPRVTKPYTDAQWEALEQLGRLVDERLRKDDVRLTMGGEPTFVAAEDMDGAEWNTGAVGPTKHLFAGKLLRRLKEHFATRGLLFFGQGKWYPGESLPRWAKAVYWRKDGRPLWQNEALLADEGASYGHGPAEAEALALAIAAQTGVEPRWLMPAYEDAYYYMWKERRLPANVDPLDSKLGNKEDRARLARIFEQGLGTKAGFVLPLQPSPTPSGWTSGPWYLNNETLWLIPGDSPVGFRLPLESIPWVAEADYPWIIEPDPMLERPPLPEPGARLQSWLRGQDEPSAGPLGRAAAPADALRAPAPQESASWIIRTALCVEPRDGRLHVFMPPLSRLEEYLDLVSRIEAAAASLKLPVVLEGSPPPNDPRIEVIKVTPDPGVLEVNMHPVSNWEDLVRNTTLLYEEARQTRLTAEKFMLDGRHTGTGGGNHIVIGGSTPSDSPFLRRPDLLKSLVGYWTNHPSLSYLFSSLFIGPTSQHPRLDEARSDSIHELELAFERTPARGEHCPPWLVDRLYRNILIDSTGNTHRAEFCIDKLYSPDSSSGRLGLVELRNFEMPPHARMSLAQQLLIRAMVGRFWNEPYEVAPMRWGTELHDRFMLPHWVRQDFNDVLAELNEAGFAFDPTWFDPHFEFRFPFMGDISRKGIHLELRTALEPWHVLGEEPGAGGTVRYVDSSLERLQVKVQGFTNPRYLLACNGRRVPLQPTGTNGEFVAGVRYRAWLPPHGLHPTIPVDSPLSFDLIDTWNSRSIGGCTSHVMHPGGRNYTTFPINAYEAESRRLARFFPHSHSPGKLNLPRDERTAEFPFTLDLRHL